MKRLVTLVVVITIALKSIAQCGSVPIATFSNTIVCNGNSTMFSDSSTTPSGTINYWSWDFGDGSALNYLQNPGYTYANAGNYIVTLIVNNSIGCADTIAQVVVVNPNPVVNFISDATLSCQPLCTYFFDASSVATGSNVAWKWNFGDGDSISSSGTVSHCYFNPSITDVSFDVSLTVTSDSGCSATNDMSNLITVSNSSCAAYVWPGDTDNNLIVNNNDLLFVGLYYGQTGGARTTQGNVWQSDSAMDWQSTTSNNVDLKHVDCNGDGTINADDTLAINANFSLTHVMPVNTDNSLVERINYDMYFVTNGTLFNAGDWVDAALWLGSSSNVIDSLYGIAFNINYDAALVEPGSENIVYAPSWLGTPGSDAIKISKVDATVNTAYGGITRINHTGASGYGKIADFKFRIKTTLPSQVTMPLYISNYKAYNAAGEPQNFTTTTSVGKIAAGSGILIYPNPFTFQTTIHFEREQKNTQVRIMDMFGKELKSIHCSGTELILERGEINPGIYFMQVMDNQKNLQTRRIIIQ